MRQYFKKTDNKKINWKVVRAIEFLSKASFPLLNVLFNILRGIKRLVS